MTNEERYTVIAEALRWCQSVASTAVADPTCAPQTSETLERLATHFGEAAAEAESEAKQVRERGGEE